MSNYNDDFNNKQDFVLVNSWEENPQSNMNGGNHNGKKKPRGKGKRFLSYVLVGVLCTALGGVASSVATIKYFNNNNLVGGQAAAGSNSQTSNNNVVKTNNTVPLSVANISQKVGPAIVGVSTKSLASYDFFGFPETQEGMGSGIIFNEDGYIITNYHVVGGAEQINVIFNDGKEGKEIPAKLVNYNASMDLAVIKLTEDVDVPAVAEFGDSDALQVGDPVIAIGNPLGKEFLGTVTSGVVSAVNRAISVEGQTQNYIQTDAAINPGNSGGALVNIYGQVIGINSAKIGGSQVEGLGFAIPIDEVKPEIEYLIKPNLVIGIVAIDIDNTLSKKYKLPIGVYIQQVQDFSPAQKAGIRPGDVILKFDGSKVKTVEEINKLKQKHNAGDTIEVEVSRDGKNKKLSLKLEE